MIPQAIHREGEADVGFELGERLLYLRPPYFSGKDVEQLQTALGALGFACGGVSGTFGAYTEGALRKFQLNMGLVPDGIAGVKTYATLRHLHNAWQDKPQIEDRAYMGFARAADVLENHAVCLFGTEEYTQRGIEYVELGYGDESALQNGERRNVARASRCEYAACAYCAFGPAL